MFKKKSKKFKATKAQIKARLKKSWAKKIYHTEALGVALTALFLFLALAIFSSHPKDPTWFYYTQNVQKISNWCGSIGAHIAALVLYLLGSAVYLLLTAIMVPAYLSLLAIPIKEQRSRILLLPVLLLSGSGLCSLYAFDITNSYPGGILGSIVSTILAKPFGFVGTAIILWALFWVSVILVTRVSVAQACIRTCKHALITITEQAHTPLVLIKTIGHGVYKIFAKIIGGLIFSLKTLAKALIFVGTKIIAVFYFLRRKKQNDTSKSENTRKKTLEKTGEYAGAYEHTLEYSNEKVREKTGDEAFWQEITQNAHAQAHTQNTEIHKNIHDALKTLDMLDESKNYTELDGAQENQDTNDNHEHKHEYSQEDIREKIARFADKKILKNFLTITELTDKNKFYMRLPNTCFSKNIFAGTGTSTDIETEDDTLTQDTSPFEYVMREIKKIHAQRHEKAREQEIQNEQEKQKEKEALRTFELPDTSLFIQKHDKAYTKQLYDHAQARGTKLEEKLQHFGIKGKLTDIKPGPLITMFEYQPEINSKISKITALEDDLAMALSAVSIRIIAPIPGKNAVGFEISNQSRESVFFSEVIASDSFKENTGQKKLPLALGVDVTGSPVIADLSSMPHLLVGGTTGSGKSVGLNGMLASLLCTCTPEQLRLILIDPKRLEFTPYADIAHLLFPIVTNPVHATGVLKWVVQEMEERYEKMSHVGVRNISEYQKLYESKRTNKREQESTDTSKRTNKHDTIHTSEHTHEHELEPMPYIAVIIDELADLMIVAGKDIEKYIVRIAQMARAAGIHMIVATQRPSVDVVTGLIKVNFPSRVAFRVSSKVDSRTILDQQGAEKLLGKGDMLFMHSSSSHLMRVHGAYISDKEIEGLTNHIRSQQTVTYLDLREALNIQNKQEQDALQDDLYPKILEFLKTTNEISISLLQRQYRIGFNRSARIIENLERDGLIAPAQGSKARKVLR